MEQNSIQLVFSEERYLQLLDLAYAVAQSLKGKAAEDPRTPDCQQLATKLFFHAATIYWLRQGTRAPVASNEREAFFYDFASIAVLTRAALETFLTMFEVFLEPVSEDEKQFRYYLWLLSGFVIRENQVLLDAELKEQYAASQSAIEGIRNILRSTQAFVALKSGEQKKVLKGEKLNKDFKSRTRAAGLGVSFIHHTYKYYSGYVHSDGLSGAQIVSAGTKEQQIEHIRVQMQIVMMILARMIVEYVHRFPEAKEAAEARPQALGLANVLSALANYAA